MPATATPPKHAYPRPPLVHDRATLFREPVYEVGQPYPLDDEDEEDPAIITA